MTGTESDLDPRKFKIALIGYTVLGIILVTSWQLWRVGDDRRERARSERNLTQVRDDLASITRAAGRFASVFKRFPDSLRELHRTRDEMGQPFLRVLPRDPWTDQSYRYSSSGSHFEVFSYGRDGEEGGEGLDADVFSRP